MLLPTAMKLTLSKFMVTARPFKLSQGPSISRSRAWNPGFDRSFSNLWEESYVCG
ncbi:hypothetical protein BJY04DRAFT_193742 [Aspergillus karnatakaensis]|uniref:uncharacterized protein n=1 Tax=Aspergillus karnatakaensis TaxID=1810916 RepID=UPI003CCD7590